MTKAVLLIAFVATACTAPATALPTTITTAPAAPPTTSTTAAALSAVPPARPFPAHAGYQAAHLTPSSDQVDADTEAYYDYWRAHYLVENDAGIHPLGVATSRGQGYAMVITALMAGYDPESQRTFDGLLRYAKAHPSDLDGHLMGSMTVPGATETGSEFGGDAEIAYALLLANRQWGSGHTADYATAARVLIGAVEHSSVGPDSHLPMLGDWVDPDGSVINQWTLRLEDIMPDHFAAFSSFTSDGLWDQVGQSSQQQVRSIDSGPSRLTGLMPAFMVSTTHGRPAPAPADFLSSSDAGAFSSSAAVYPLRVGSFVLTSGDHFWGGEMRKLSHWAAAVTEGDPTRLHDGYELNGTPLDSASPFSAEFGAPFAVAAMTNVDQQNWLDALYDAVRTRHEGYTADSITLLSLLVLGGNWWEP
jgi:hypothetical protein